MSATVAPSLANMSAPARPMPVPAPVIQTTLPLNSPIRSSVRPFRSVATHLALLRAILRHKHVIHGRRARSRAVAGAERFDDLVVFTHREPGREQAGRLVDHALDHLRQP